MADEQNPVFDQTIPSPEPITLTFGEEGAPEIQEPAAPTDAASDVLARAQDALAQAEGALSDVQGAAAATLASNGISPEAAANAAADAILGTSGTPTQPDFSAAAQAAAATAQAPAPAAAPCGRIRAFSFRKALPPPVPARAARARCPAARRLHRSGGPRDHEWLH